MTTRDCRCRWSWTTRAGWKRTRRRSRRFAGRPRASVHAQGAAATGPCSVRSDCPCLGSMGSPKPSRPGQRRSVPLASGLGIPPMTLDLDVICISGVPISGIAAIGAASARQFFLGDVELVGLAGADHEMALAAVSNLAGDRVVEEAMLEPIDDEPFQAIERLADLSAGDFLPRGCDRRITH